MILNMRIGQFLKSTLQKALLISFQHSGMHVQEASLNPGRRVRDGCQFYDTIYLHVP